MSKFVSVKDLAFINDIFVQYKFICVDKKIVDLYPQINWEECRTKLIIIEDPEKSKNFNDALSILEDMLSTGVARTDKVLAIGGGALSDLVGFISSIMLRGLSWDVVPTTLLSLVDASIGGKTAVNSQHGKNLIGSFHKPGIIYQSELFLKTLAKEQISSGFGEVAKYALLSEKIYKLILNEVSTLELIQACADYKVKIVDEDFTETGKRKILNLGHTFGHPFEFLTKSSHGISIVWGTKLILKIFRPELEKSYDDILKKLGVPLDFLGRFICEDFFKALVKDKKNINSGFIELIIPVQNSQVEIRKIELEKLRKKIEENEFFRSFSRD